MGKITYESVNEYFTQRGWKLISQTYNNLKEDLEVMCPEGHTNFVSFEKFRRPTYDCPICKKNPYTKVNTNAQKKEGYRILAFDQASITSGWSVFDDDKLISYGKQTSEGNRSTERIAKTKYWVASMIDKWKPDEIIFEDIQLQKFTTAGGKEGDAVLTFKKLAHLQGVLKNYCYENGFIYKVVPPSTWRAHSEIKGRSRTDQKRNAQLKVKQLYDVSVTQDEADAILIGRWGVHSHNQNKIIMF